MLLILSLAPYEPRLAEFYLMLGKTERLLYSAV